MSFDQALAMREKNGDFEGVCGTLCNLALAHADANDFESAHAAVDNAIRTGREHGRAKGWSLALFQKAFLYKREGKQAVARKYSDLAIHTWRKTGQPIPEQFISLTESFHSENGEK